MFFRYITLLLIVCTALTGSHAQELKLIEAVKQLETQLQPVKGTTLQIQQQLNLAKPAYRVTFVVSKTDAKGKVKVESYQVNLADINPATIAYKVDKDLITVTAGTHTDRGFVRYAENGIWKSFTDQIKLYGDNPEAARNLSDKLRNTVLLADKVYQPTPLPTSYEGVALWLKANIGDEQVNAETYRQSLSFDSHSPLRATFRQAQLDNQRIKTDEVAYTVNVADLSDDAIKLSTKGPYVRLTLATQKKLKYIRAVAVGKAENLNEFDIVGIDPDRIRDIERAWRNLITLAQKQLLAQSPPLNTLADAQELIRSAVNTVRDDDGPVEQRIQPDCACMLVRTYTSGRTPREDSYLFNLGDLAEKTIKTAVVRDGYSLTVKTLTGERMITVYTNGARQNYTSELDIVTDNLEAFRYLPQAFEKAILTCRQTQQSPVPNGSSASILAWLTKQMPTLQNASESLRVSLAPINATDCLVQLTEQTTGRSVSEIRYDLPLKDLDIDNTAFTITGKNVFVTLPINKKEKLIKTQKDGKPSDYTHTIRLQIDDLDKARYVVDAFRQLSKRCH